MPYRIIKTSVCDGANHIVGPDPINTIIYGMRNIPTLNSAHQELASYNDRAIRKPCECRADIKEVQ